MAQTWGTRANARGDEIGQAKVSLSLNRENAVLVITGRSNEVTVRIPLDSWRKLLAASEESAEKTKGLPITTPGDFNTSRRAH